MLEERGKQNRIINAFIIFDIWIFFFTPKSLNNDAKLVMGSIDENRYRYSIDTLAKVSIYSDIFLKIPIMNFTSMN